MLKTFGEKLIIKKLSVSSMLVINDFTNKYEVVEVGDKLDKKLIGKIIYVEDGLKKIEYNNQEYFIVDIQNVLAYEE